MLVTKTKTLSVVCNTSNKRPDGRYVIPMGALSTESIVGASLKSAVYRNLFYNVVGSGVLKNNGFYFNLDGVPQLFETPEGFYTIDQIIPIVQAGVQALLDLRAPTVQTVTITRDAITAKVTITVTDNGNLDVFELTGGTFPDSVNALLGNTIDVTLDAITPTPYQLNQMYDMSGEDASQLIIEEISKGSGLYNSSASSFGSTNGLVKMLSYRGSGFGELCDYQNPDPVGTMLMYQTIYLQTASGAILDNQGSDIHIELLLYML